MPDFPVLYYLPEFAQTHVHRSGIAKGGKMESNEVFSQGKIIGLAGIVVSAQANFLSLTNFALLFPQKVAPQTELHLCPLLTDCSSFYL